MVPAAPSAPSRLPPPGGLVHAQRARLGLRHRRPRPAGLQPHAQRPGDHRPVALQPAGAGARGTRGDRAPRSRRRAPRAARAVPRRGRDLRGAGAAHRPPLAAAVLALAAVDGILALVGRALTRAAVAATLKPDGQLEAGNTLLNVSFSLCFAIGPAHRRSRHRGLGRERGALGQLGLFAAMTVTLATSRSLPPAHADARRAGSRACARASATRSATRRCADLLRARGRASCAPR